MTRQPSLGHKIPGQNKQRNGDVGELVHAAHLPFDRNRPRQIIHKVYEKQGWNAECKSNRNPPATIKNKKNAKKSRVSITQYCGLRAAPGIS